MWEWATKAVTNNICLSVCLFFGLFNVALSHQRYSFLWEEAQQQLRAAATATQGCCNSNSGLLQQQLRAAATAIQGCCNSNSGLLQQQLRAFAWLLR
jgi:hypothetical protein